MQDAGADALELNIYFVPPTRHDGRGRRTPLPRPGGGREGDRLDSAGREDRALLQRMAHLAEQLADAGPTAWCCSTASSSPTSTWRNSQITPNLVLSNRYEMRVPLRWIAILHEHLSISLAATSGMHYAEDVIKALLAGADVGMIASALLKDGPETLGKLREDLRVWMEEKEYESVEQLKGSMSRELPGPERPRTRQLHEGPGLLHHLLRHLTGAVAKRVLRNSTACGAPRRRPFLLMLAYECRRGQRSSSRIRTPVGRPCDTCSANDNIWVFTPRRGNDNAAQGSADAALCAGIPHPVGRRTKTTDKPRRGA